jgi:hypothetical protein
MVITWLQECQRNAIGLFICLLLLVSSQKRLPKFQNESMNFVTTQVPPELQVQVH